MKRHQSMYQAEQSRNKDSSGRYKRAPRCQGCGKSAGHRYASHPLTDCVGDDGQPWHDTALCLCRRCARVTQDMRNVSEFKAFKSANNTAPPPPGFSEPT